MKKSICLFLLIALCAAAVFAADVAASVKICIGVNEKGFQLKEGTASVNMSVSGDAAGAEYKLAYVIKPENNWNGFGVHINYWNKPIDSFKFTAGAKTFISLNDFSSSDFVVYVKPVYSKTDETTGDIKNITAIFGSDVLYSDMSKSTYFAYADAQVVRNNENKTTLDAVAMTHFTVENRKFNLKLVNAEIAYIPFYSNGFGKKGEVSGGNISHFGSNPDFSGLNGINVESVANHISWDLYDDEYVFGTSWASTKAEQRKIALRYKYSVANSPEKNGLYAFFEARNHTLSIDKENANKNSSFTGIFEIGLSGADVELGYMFSTVNEEKKAYTVRIDTNFGVRLVNSKLKLDLSYAGIKGFSNGGIKLKEDVNPLNATGYLHLEYFNSEERSERDNGLFFTTFFNSSIGANSLQPMFRIGLNKLDGSKKPVFDFNLNSNIGY